MRMVTPLTLVSLPTHVDAGREAPPDAPAGSRSPTTQAVRAIRVMVVLLSRGPADFDRCERVDLGGIDKTFNTQILSESRIWQAARRPVVDRRDAVARQDGGVREPARDVVLGPAPEDLLVRALDRGDERMVCRDLRTGRRDVDLVFEPVLREALLQAPDKRDEFAARLRQRQSRRHANIEKE